MTKSYSNSRRKSARFFLYAVLGFIVLVTLVDGSLSFLAHKKFSRLSRSLGAQGLYLSAEAIYFNLFSGLVVRGPRLERAGRLLFSARRLDLGFDAVSLLSRRIRVKNIDFCCGELHLNDVFEAYCLLPAGFGGDDRVVGFFSTTYFRGTDFSVDRALFADIRGYCSFLKDGLLISRGRVTLKKIQLPGMADADIFYDSGCYKPLDYVFEAKPGDSDDFGISRFELSNTALNVSGGGKLTGLLSKPRAELTINFMKTKLAGFPALNNARVQSEAVVDSVLSISGPFESLKTSLSMKINQGRFSVFDSLFLTGVEGDLVADADRLRGENWTMSVNGFPLRADFFISERNGYPHITLKLFSLPKDFGANNFVLGLSADLLKHGLVGDLKVRAQTVFKDLLSVLDFDAENVRLGYRGDIFVNAARLGAGLSFAALSAPDKNGTAGLAKDVLELEDFFCSLARRKDGFVLADITAHGYGGVFKGEVNISSGQEAFAARGEVHLRGLDLGEFFKRSVAREIFLSGRLDGDLRFNSESKDLLRGQLFVRRGEIFDNPVLGSVADFLGLPSLKHISFRELAMFFRGRPEGGFWRLNFNSSGVTGLLDVRLPGGGILDGYLSVGIATELLGESKRFKKILAYIRHDEPFVVFPFKLSSYIRSPRVLWLKNEFKEKLTRLLPERNKLVLQGEINTLLEKIEEK